MDSEDDEWLQEKSNKLQLTANDFEKYMEFLENNCKKQVPEVDDMRKFFKSPPHSQEAIDETYDYWLGKRLNSRGMKLMLQLKKEDENRKKTVRKNEDPYIAFRACREKMHLRKNRMRDNVNYIRMLLMRENLVNSVNYYKSTMHSEKAKHQLLKMKFLMFEDQFRKKDFGSFFFEENFMAYDNEYLMNEIPLDNSDDSEREEIQQQQSETKPNDSVEDAFVFVRNTGCQFYGVRNFD